FDAVAGTTYRIAVDGYLHRSGTVETGPVVLDWAQGPANDPFAAAEPLSGSSGTRTGTNAGATLEPGEPEPRPGNAGGASVWYRWTPATGGTATIDTFGSAFDAVLAVYTGSSLAGLTAVAGNDDASGSVRQSSVTFSASAGTVYWIAVDGYHHRSTGVLET